MKTGPRLSGFTSEKSRVTFMTAYEAALDDAWPQRRTVEVETSFGTTRVVMEAPSGAGGAPFVLLPGGGGNALMWHGHLDALRSSARPIVAIDPIGDPGGSTQRRPFADGAEVAAWLDEVLTALDIDRAHMIGASYGGW